MSILLRFDPDGGDLGRGVKVTALELAIIAPHIANIFQAIIAEQNMFFDTSQLRPMKYGFEVWSRDKKYLGLALNDIRLPSNVGWYECDGKKIFELKSPSGGLSTSLVCYLITK